MQTDGILLNSSDSKRVCNICPWQKVLPGCGTVRAYEGKNSILENAKEIFFSSIYYFCSEGKKKN